MTTAIIGSLGGNYSWKLARLALWQLINSQKSQLDELREKLEAEFDATVVLTYKGRDAIEYVLSAYGVAAGDQVLTQAFTCHAIEEAITRVGAEPVFVDLGSDGFNPDVKTLDKALAKAPKAKLVLIQHTLGIPATMKPLAAWAAKHKLVLVEDLAQGYGATDEDGRPVGSLADAVILSFGRDKIIDAVSGGAAALRRKPTTELPMLSPAPMSAWWRDVIYPTVVLSVRSTFDWGLGKVILKVATATGLLRSPVASPTTTMHSLPVQLAAMVLGQLRSLAQQREHRLLLGEFYQHELKMIPIHQSRVPAAACSLVRWPVMVDDPDQLAKQLKKSGIYLTDRWYRVPVDSGSLNRPSAYVTGSCPRAEKLAAKVFNLPTHGHISLEQATRVITALKANVKE